LTRIVGIDLGERRIGVAAADDRLNIAIPVETVDAGPDAAETIARVAESQNAGELVVGLPLSLTGTAGQQAQLVLKVVDDLRGRLSIPVTTWDERLSSTEADKRRAPGKVGRGGVGRDAIAASVMLQACLDARRTGIS
jgi:putative Holliday junction resolvase